MKKKLTGLLNILNRLDDNRMTIVTYLPSTMELVMRQRGTIVARLNHLVGYMIPIKHACLLLPEDLQELKASLNYILNDLDEYFIAPIPNGYKIWERGDITYTSKPRYLTKLKVHSISNRFLLWLFKLRSEEARVLFRTMNHNEQ